MHDTLLEWGEGGLSTKRPTQKSISGGGRRLARGGDEHGDGVVRATCPGGGRSVDAAPRGRLKGMKRKRTPRRR